MKTEEREVLKENLKKQIDELSDEELDKVAGAGSTASNVCSGSVEMVGGGLINHPMYYTKGYRYFADMDYGAPYKIGCYGVELQTLKLELLRFCYKRLKDKNVLIKIYNIEDDNLIETYNLNS